MTSIRRLGPLLAATVLLAGCGSSSQSRSTTPAPATAAAAGPAPAVAGANVDIASYKFAPMSIAVARGGSVTFTNWDPTPHTATVEGGFDTGTLQTGQAKKVTFNRPGTFAYHCVFHAFMTGSLVVS